MSQYVYKWREDSDRYCVVTGVDSNEATGLSPYEGLEYCRAIGRPLQLRPVYDERGPLSFSDFPYYSSQPKVMSERAWDALSDLLEPFGLCFHAVVVEFELKYRVWFPQVVANCLIEHESEFFESLSGFRKLLKPVFLASAVPERGPFTVQGFEKREVWVRKAFVDAVKRSDLKGAVFNKRARIASKAAANYALERTDGPGFDVF